MAITEDRRSSPRARVRGVATISLHNQRVKCWMLNVGVSGMAMRSTAPLPSGSFLRIRFPLPGGAGHLDTDAVLLRRQNKGPDWLWAVRFENPQPHVIAKILDYVHSYRSGVSIPTHAAGAAGGGEGEGRSEGESRDLLLNKLYKEALTDLFGQ